MVHRQAPIVTVLASLVCLVLTHAPATALDGQIKIGSVPYTISASGSYVLTTNASTSLGVESGITFAADNVTLDLNGHVITGTGSGSGPGVGINVGNRSCVTIKNGVVTGFGSHGVYASGGACGVRVEGIVASGNGGDGFQIDRGIIWNCTAYDNADEGFELSETNVNHCISHNNAGDGFRISDSGVVSRCLVYDNAGDGIYCRSATVTKCNVNGNGGNGIDAGSGGFSHVFENSSVGNTGSNLVCEGVNLCNDNFAP